MVKRFGICDSFFICNNKSFLSERSFFEECGIGNNLDIMSALLNCSKRLETLEVLSLSGNGINSSGGIIIAEFIAGNPTLRHLHLDNNSMGDDVVGTFVHALKKNTKLREIFIAGNKFSSNGEKEFRKALFDDSSLNSIAESNHFCCLWMTYGAKWSKGAVEDIQTTEYCAERKICVKIQMALFPLEETSQKVNLRYLDDVPLQLIPYALELVQKKNERLDWYDDFLDEIYPTLLEDDDVDSKSLSRLFQVLRGWEMPKLFERRYPDMPIKKRKCCCS